MMHLKPRARVALALLTLAGGLALLSPPAEAWWRGGVFVGVAPGFAYAPPPYYYPPPYYPPVYYTPPYSAPPVPQAQAQPPAQQGGKTQVAKAYGATCYAGFYTCSAPLYTPIGDGCTCPGIGAPSYGSVR